MKTKIVAFVGMLVVLLGATAANAQLTDPLNFRTPFAFVIGDKLVPGGEYRVSMVSPTGTLSFRSQDGNVSMLVGSLSVETLKTADRFKLIFHRYGAHYYLSEIWTPGNRTGRTIQPRAGELEVAKNEPQQHVTLFVDAIGN